MVKFELNRSVARYPDSMSICVSSWWICSFMNTISHFSTNFNSTESTAILRASRCTPLVESNTTKSLPMQKKSLPMYKKSLPMYLVKIFILEDFLYIFRPAPLGNSFLIFKSSSFTNNLIHYPLIQHCMDSN